MTAYRTVKTGKMVKEYSLEGCCPEMAKLARGGWDENEDSDDHYNHPPEIGFEDGNVFLQAKHVFPTPILFCPFCGVRLVVLTEEVPEEVQVKIEPSRPKGPGFRVRHDDGELPAEFDGVFETHELAVLWMADVERSHPGWKDRLQVVWSDD